MGINCQVARDAAEKLELELPGFGPEDVRDGKKKPILKLMWQLCRYGHLKALI